MDQQSTNGECQEQQEKDHVGGVRADLRDDVELPGGERKHQNHDDEVEGLVHGRFLSREWRAELSFESTATVVNTVAEKGLTCLVIE